MLIHGIVRDSEGRKMSKSLGNGIDPLEVIDKYGADALRLMLVTGNSPGNDMRFYWERVKASRNFINKVWNASRFMMMNMEGVDISGVTQESLVPEDKWILSLLNRVVKDVTDNMERFELGIAMQKVYDFVWEQFCDWYIEMVKPRFYQSDDAASKAAAAWTLRTVLATSLKLLHPFIPFVTEEIYGYLETGEETIMRSAWPLYDPARDFPEEEQRIEWAKDVVRAVRLARVNLNVPAAKKPHIFIVSESEKVREALSLSAPFIAALASGSAVKTQADRSGIGDDAVSAVTPAGTVYLPLAELVDMDKERERLKNEEKRLEGEIRRSDGMLKNEKFLAKAPAAKVEEEKAKREKYARMLADVKERLAQMGE